jgi:hypothetical protein
MRTSPSRLSSFFALGAVVASLGCAPPPARVAAPPAIPPPAPEPTPKPTPEATPPPAAAPAADAFASTVQPVLFRTCTPCHVPGGRMYERMPFDQPATVRDHQAGILRRLKGADKDAVAAWLASQ